MSPSITKLAYYIPSENFSTEYLLRSKPKNVVDKIILKTGINKKFKAKDFQYASDLAIEAIKKLISKKNVDVSEIDFVIFCNQTPNHILPMSSPIIQKEIFNLRNNIGFIDISQGCSGYIYSLKIAASLVKSKACKKVLIVTADTYSKIIDKGDVSTLAIFGDGASASIVENTEYSKSNIGNFSVGCDGSKLDNLYLPNSGLEKLEDNDPSNLIMNGTNIFSFTLKKVPENVEECLKKNDIKKNQIKYFVFHQANKYILETLRDKLEIENEKFIIDLSYGNTTSSTIPIALYNLIKSQKVLPEDNILLCGFGVGLSWGSTIIKCDKELINSIVSS